MITTRNICGTDDTCEPCGGCERCLHYHELRHEVKRLRRQRRRLIQVMRQVMLYAGAAAEFDDGDDCTHPAAVSARRAIAAAERLIGKVKTEQ